MLGPNDNEANIADQYHEGDSPRHNHDGYMKAAREAYASGDRVLAMHLYLSAYEEACGKSPLPDMEAVSALKEAWRVASELRERSIAEYIFDKLEAHLSSEEVESCARDLQSMALDKLSELGISRTDLEGMADMISEEIGATAHISGITPIATSVRVHPGPGPVDALRLDASHDDAPSHAQQAAVQDEALDSPVHSDGAAQPPFSESSSASPASVSPDAASSAGTSAGERSGEEPPRLKSAYPLLFDDLVGFDAVIDDMRAFGIGVKQDEEYRLLVDTLRERHGIDGLSAAGSIVFRTSSREDASMFMAAVAGELGLPVLRVQMQPGPQGMPVLCVTTAADRPMRMGPNKLSLDAPSVLILEDYDLWGAPLMEAASAVEGENIMLASMSRAAREAFTLIASAVGNPDIYVLASMSGESSDQGFLYDLMEPMNIVDIYLPDELERRQIWDAIAHDHPSVRELDLSRLTRFSRNLSRFDIVAAGREAVEDAYRQSLKARRYVPVSQSMMFEHVANFQPLESEEYRFLEEAVVTDFKSGLDDLLEDMFERDSTQESLEEGNEA